VCAGKLILVSKQAWQRLSCSFNERSTVTVSGYAIVQHIIYHSYRDVSSLLLQHQQQHHSTSNRPKGTAVRQEQPTLVSTLQGSSWGTAAVQTGQE
jgi:hypothetical protein